jgi:hypothetical protein
MHYDVASLSQDFADAFVGLAAFEKPLPFEAQLPRGELDYSLESLHALDRYLDLLHRNADIVVGQSETDVVLGAGCYLGEVIRRHASVRYQWVNYHDFFPTRPKLAELVPYSVGNSAVLVADGGGMTMPLNKIGRYIEEGPCNNTFFYAGAEIRSLPK